MRKRLLELSRPIGNSPSSSSRRKRPRRRTCLFLRMYIKGSILVLRATEAFYALLPRSEHAKTAEENQEYSPTRCPLGEVDIGCEPSSTGGYQNARRNYERYLA